MRLWRSFQYSQNILKHPADNKMVDTSSNSLVVDLMEVLNQQRTSLDSFGSILHFLQRTTGQKIESEACIVPVPLCGCNFWQCLPYPPFFSTNPLAVRSMNLKCKQLRILPYCRSYLTPVSCFSLRSSVLLSRTLCVRSGKLKK